MIPTDSNLMTMILRWPYQLQIRFITQQSVVMNKSKGHNLLDLFDLLPSKIQMNIQQLVDCSQFPFREMLKNTSDLFEECRYVYEYRSLHINLKFLQELSASLKTVSHKIIISEFIAQTSPSQCGPRP